jgi:hypothetical protein
VRHRPQAHPRRQGREKTFDYPGTQFQRAFALAMAPHGTIAVPQHADRPGRRYVLAGASDNQSVAHPVDHDFRQPDVQSAQLFANTFPFRFIEALAYLTLERVEVVFISARTAPM